MSRAILSHGCECVSEHSPTAYVPTDHHILPKSWGGQTIDANLVTICPNTHAAVHRLLDDYVRAGGDPGWETRKHFSAFQRDLALRAWERRPSDNPPITSVIG
jgi:5-methylcytosine-specific restriction endonuclease McrA